MEFASPISSAQGDESAPFFQVNWDLLVKNSDFLSESEYLMLEKSETLGDDLLKTESTAQNFARLLVKIAENCSSDFGVLKFVFSKMETTLRLGPTVTSSGTASRASLFKLADGSVQEGLLKDSNKTMVKTKH